jgi:hypothetical protein
MKNKTLADRESKPHGASTDSQFSLTANQVLWMNIIAQYTGIKLTEDTLIQLLEAAKKANLTVYT